MSDQNQNYREQIAQMRYDAAVRQQNQLVREAQALHAEVQENEQAAAEALAQGDTETANYYVEQLTDKEQELAHVAQQLPPPQPQADPRDVNFMNRRAAFFQRHGQQGAAAYDAAHRYLAGRGWTPRTPGFYKAMDDLMEMHGKQYYGVTFDPNADKSLTPDEAAQISFPNDPHAVKRYDQAYQQLKRQGRVR
jgi:hypothetical protein